MCVFDHFQHINLTNDQRDALTRLSGFLESEDRVFILQGYAGTGKTTLLKGFVEYLISKEKKFQLMAPTGRAAKVINQKTGFESTTIHKGIYSFGDLREIKEEDDESQITFLYQYEIRNNPEVHDTTMIIDEASMVSDILSQGEFFRFGSGHLLRDLVSYGRLQESGTTSKLIFVGDPAQLPPVGMNFSPALDPQYLKDTYGFNVSLAEMKEVKRQDASNGILPSSIKIRQCLTSGYFTDFNLRGNQRDIINPAFHEYLESYKAHQGPKVIICYKNKTALDLNRAIRMDKFGADLPIQASDTIIVGGNNYRMGIMNGEFGVVAEAGSLVETREIRFKINDGKMACVILTWRSITLIMPDENNQPKSVSGNILENFLYGDNDLNPEVQRALYIDFKNRHPKLRKGTEEFKEAIINDQYFNCIRLKYGYAVTCHKAQGGEWPSAFVFWDKGTQSNFNFYESEHNRSGKTNPDFYRWAYTAVTRASEKLFCINPPFFTSFSGMVFIEIPVQRAFKELTGEKMSSVEIWFDQELEDELKRFRLEEAPLPIQNHYIRRWYLLRKQYIDIVRWERIGYEIRYYFKRENQTAAFKYWVNGKNEFRAGYQKLPSSTNSDEFFDTVVKILDEPLELNVIRNTAQGIISKIEFDQETEEKKPFLKRLYDGISGQLLPGEVISDVSHLEYRDRYTFEKNGFVCVVDFEYNKGGFFGRVLPIENRSKGEELLIRIREMVHKLKEADYVV